MKKKSIVSKIERVSSCAKIGKKDTHKVITGIGVCTWIRTQGTKLITKHVRYSQLTPKWYRNKCLTPPSHPPAIRYARLQSSTPCVVIMPASSWKLNSGSHVAWSWSSPAHVTRYVRPPVSSRQRLPRKAFLARKQCTYCCSWPATSTGAGYQKCEQQKY